MVARLPGGQPLSQHRQEGVQYSKTLGSQWIGRLRALPLRWLINRAAASRISPRGLHRLRCIQGSDSSLFNL